MHDLVRELLKIDFIELTWVTTFNVQGKIQALAEITVYRRKEMDEERMEIEYK